MLVVGIDEAGLGAAVGPLVIAAFGLSIPGRTPDQTGWGLLAPLLTQKPDHTGAHLHVADSKLLSSRPDGHRLLERAALAAIANLPQAPAPACTTDLLQPLCPHAITDIQHCPWYGHDIPLPAWNDPASLQLATALLHRAAQRVGAALGPIHAEILTEPVFNQWIHRRVNKANLVWQTTARLVVLAADAGADWIVLDRQGGRQYYLERLRPILPATDWHILREEDGLAEYTCRLQPQARMLTIRIQQAAESRWLEVAWASIFAKYTRELLMHRIARFSRDLCPDVPATAGYHPDGIRWLNAITPRLLDHGVNAEQIRRVK